MDTSWIKTLVPLIGTALGGPLGGAAASFIADKLGLETKTVEAVNEVLNSGKLSPEQISGLKLAELEFKKFLEEKEIKLEELSAKDRDSARQRESSVKDNTPRVLAGIVTLGFFGVLIYMMVYGAPTEGKDAFLILLGSLGTGWASVIAYYFGSSSGSENKNRTIERLSESKGN